MYLKFRRAALMFQTSAQFGQISPDGDQKRIKCAGVPTKARPKRALLVGLHITKTCVPDSFQSHRVFPVHLAKNSNTRLPVSITQFNFIQPRIFHQTLGFFCQKAFFCFTFYRNLTHLQKHWRCEGTYAGQNYVINATFNSL